MIPVRVMKLTNKRYLQKKKKRQGIRKYQINKKCTSFVGFKTQHKHVVVRLYVTNSIIYNCRQQLKQIEFSCVLPYSGE